MPVLNDADQIAERLHHATQRADGAFMPVNVFRRGDHAALCGFRPAGIPAVNRPGPGEIRQQLNRAGLRVPQFAQRHRNGFYLRAGFSSGHFQHR